jgi:long-chain acyl-CoA synthetase
MTGSSYQNVGKAETIFAAFENAAERFADEIALKGAGGKGLIMTYAQVADRAKRLAAGLQTPEFQDIHEIGLLSENRPEWSIAYLGIIGSGRTVVPIDANLRPNEMEAIVGHARLGAIFVSARFEPVVNNFERDLRVFSFDADNERNWAKLDGNPVDHTSIGSRESTAALIYTSGTTGAPKAVLLTHGNILTNLADIQAAIVFDEKDAFLSLLPLHHTFEATCGMLTPLTNGCTIVYARSLKSREIMEDLAANRITVMVGVPLLYEKIYQSMHRKIMASSALKRTMFKSLFAASAAGWKLKRKWGKKLFAGLRKKAGMTEIRLFVSGAAAMPPHIARFFTLLGFDFLQGYGMTETSPVLTCNRPDDIRFGSVGRPLDSVEVKIDNPDESGTGEILVRGGNCTQGYKNNPEQTAALIRDGWLHTGDLGCFKDDHLWITGRAKNVIVSAAGKNIYPEEIEERLMASDYILESIVFGRKRDGRQGEDVRALVVPDLEQLRTEFGIDPANPDRARIEEIVKQAVSAVNTEIAEYKRISGFEVQLHELEKTSTKKVKRFIYS